jgi:hypothetical protein
MSQNITINLPESLYELLNQAAQLTQQPLESIIAQSLGHTLPPLLEEIPPAYQAEVYPLLSFDVNDLQQEVKKTFPANQWAEYEALLLAKKDRSLSQLEQAKLDTLRKQADVLTLRKGYAALLLKRRGYAVPIFDDLA